MEPYIRYRSYKPKNFAPFVWAYTNDIHLSVYVHRSRECFHQWNFHYRRNQFFWYRYTFTDGHFSVVKSLFLLYCLKGTCLTILIMLVPFWSQISVLTLQQARPKWRSRRCSCLDRHYNIYWLLAKPSLEKSRPCRILGLSACNK